MATHLAPAVARSRGGCAIALGNNDVFPDYAIRLDDPTFYSEQAAAAAKLCKLSADEEASLARGGYYARAARGGWPRILSLNTDIYTTRASAPPLDIEMEPDPYGQMEWVEAELEAAARANTQVIIIGHMPPCLDYYTRQPNWQRGYAQRYWSLVMRHASVVAAQLYAHQHTNQFRVWSGVGGEEEAAARAAEYFGGEAPSVELDASAAESQPLLMLSSVSPVFGNNPSFAVIGFGDELKPRELVGYYAGLDAHTMIAEKAPPFVELFNTSDPLHLTFGNVDPPWLTNAAFADRAARMQDIFPTAEGEAAWEIFHRDVATNGNMTSDRSCFGFALDELKGDCKVCKGGCRVAWICLLRHGLSRGEYEACLGRLMPPTRSPRVVTGVGARGAAYLSGDLARMGYRPAHGPTSDLFG